MTTHLMVVPSTGCPASCSYCFGPRAGGAVMTPETVAAIVRWQRASGSDEPLEVTFHGGEPLLAGPDYYRRALPGIRAGLAPRPLRFGIQSNLWLLSDELCELFGEHRVAIGTSLDGPEASCDAQRGEGYFRRTMRGIERARRHGLEVGCICTFTPALAERAAEVFDFFHREGLDFTIHPAVASLREERDGQCLESARFGDLLLELLDRYLGHLDRIRIRTLDAICRSVSAGRGGICTFTDCLGDYLAVGPDGAIYPCQRFVGLLEHSVGRVDESPSRERMAETPTWRAMRAREERIGEACADCPSLPICRGGCPYNVLADGKRLHDIPGSRLQATPSELRDPHCGAYRRIFAHVRERAVAEVLAPANLDDIVARPSPERGLLRHGRLISLLRRGRHPADAARSAREILAAVALAVDTDAGAVARLDALGVCGSSGAGRRTAAHLRSLRERLSRPSCQRNNLYLHVTFRCNLACSHCYASAGEGRSGAMPVDALSRACRQAVHLGFRHAVITGGEPLLHPERGALLDSLATQRAELKPMLTVLRTNLAVELSDELARQLAHATDEVVVSVDGDQTTHDARRGPGSRSATVANLRALLSLRPSAEVSLAAVLPAAEIQGPPGEAVRELARELGLRRARFKPLLPLGRAMAAGADLRPETTWGHLDPGDAVGGGLRPESSCGLGQNLYVEPDGDAYPCYAWRGERWRLGSIHGPGGVTTVVESEAFRALSAHTVDSNRRCRACALRYLCGGACRAWNRQREDEQLDLDASPDDCSRLHRRARAVLDAALARLEISKERWLDVGLPLPEGPPSGTGSNQARAWEER